MTTPATSKGLEGVVAASTRLSDVRGDIGQLIYCGYDIDELAGRVSYEEVVHLLHHNHLPNGGELEELKSALAAYREIPKGVLDIIKKFPKTTPPMHAIRTAVSALGCFDTTCDDDSMDAQRRKARRLIAQIPVVTAYFHRHRQKKELIHPDPTLGEAANFLYMINGEKPTDEMVSTMDMCYVLHADHGMNASTFSARVTIATLSDMYSAMTTAVGTLKGPLHGGANEEVMIMLDEIGSMDKVESFVKGKLERKELIMGFGHRVYKAYDPRATYLKTFAKQIATDTGNLNLFNMSQSIEEIVLAAKADKGIFPNVDFYSATTYHCLGIKTDLFTCMFAMSRMSGWCGHCIEQLQDNRLIRPQAKYTGPHAAPYVATADRR